MQSIKEYWYNEKENYLDAREHVSLMNKTYKEEISEAIQNSIIYDGHKTLIKPESIYNTEVIIKDLDVVSAILEEPSGSAAVLNFAAYKTAGGAFLRGSRTQEGSLCHESFLYNVLIGCHEYYMGNGQGANKGLYYNRALFSPNIKFIREGKAKLCDVLTCSAPNKAAAEKFHYIVTKEENTQAIQSRIEFILGILAEQQKETLILGAFGCGLFEQNPEEVAAIFKETLNTSYKNIFKKVIFAIPDGVNNNLKTFQKVFSL